MLYLVNNKIFGFKKIVFACESLSLTSIEAARARREIGVAVDGQLRAMERFVPI